MQHTAIDHSLICPRKCNSSERNQFSMHLGPRQKNRQKEFEHSAELSSTWTDENRGVSIPRQLSAATTESLEGNDNGPLKKKWWMWINLLFLCWSLFAERSFGLSSSLVLMFLLLHRLHFFCVQPAIASLIFPLCNPPCANVVRKSSRNSRSNEH